MRHLLVGLVFATSLLAACGGSTDPSIVEETRAAPAAAGAIEAAVLTALSADCSELVAHDSGHVVYVVAARTCSGVTTQAFRLGARRGVEALLESVHLDMRVGDEMDGITIPGLGVRRVGLYRAGQWRQLANTQSWQPRDGSGLLFLGGELYLLGGWLWGPVTSEVWKTRNLVDWEFLGHAPWPARHGAAWLVHDQKLWVIGGDLHADVWSSRDGSSWTQEAQQAPFGRRYTPNAASLEGRIVVYAGQAWNGGSWCDLVNPCVAEAPRDVWSSVDGREWSRATAQAPWEGRGLIHGSMAHDGQIFLLGGGLKAVPPGETYSQTIAEFQDIWSSRDGVDWVRRTVQYSFAARTHFSVLATPRGCYVSDGSVGTQANVVNDVFFAADCLNYAAVADPPPLEPRHASSLAHFNGSLVILGGPPAGGAGTAVWQYFH